jgi:hypothetical protein
MGEKMARLMKLQPKMMPAQRAMSAGASIPSSAMYSGKIGAIWLIPMDTMKVAAQQI